MVVSAGNKPLLGLVDDEETQASAARAAIADIEPPEAGFALEAYRGHLIREASPTLWWFKNCPPSPTF